MDTRAWHRRLLLGSVAVGALASGAQADELSDLKSQLQALQARVNQIEAQPAVPSVPEGASLITFHRGSEALADWQVGLKRHAVPSDRGFTVAITPAADMPAPVTVVTVGGYVKGDVIYDFDQDLGDFFSYSIITDDEQTENHVRLHARQTRFNIKSKTDTAIGEIRTLIEVDFLDGGTFGRAQTPTPRMRYAWGEWDFLPGWTFGAGQTDRTAMPAFAGITTVDFNGQAGLVSLTRVAQVQLKYVTGPWTFAYAIEEPTCEGRAKDENDCRVTIDNDAVDVVRGRPSNKIPDLASRVQYDHPDGHQFALGSVTRFFNTDGDPEGVLFDTAEVSEQAMGWVVLAGANIAVHEALLLTLTATYGDGAGNYINGLGNPAAWQASDGDVHTIKALGLSAGATYTINDAWTANVGWGYANPDDDDVKDCMAEIEGDGGFCSLEGNTRELHSVHANVIWKPVKQLQMGWEVMWSERKVFDLEDEEDDSFEKEKADALRIQYGVWFFF